MITTLLEKVTAHGRPSRRIREAAEETLRTMNLKLKPQSLGKVSVICWLIVPIGPSFCRARRLDSQAEVARSAIALDIAFR